jgi:hypothetical protein
MRYRRKRISMGISGAGYQRFVVQESRVAQLVRSVRAFKE